MEASSIIAEFTHRADLPRNVLAAATEQREKLAPFFIAEIESYLAKSPSRPAAHALFFIFHLLGEWREKSAYPVLARLLRMNEVELDAILGSGVTMSSHRVMAAVFDGDPQPLFEIILDPQADEFIRARMCEALSMLVREGALDRDITARFLEECFAALEPQAESYVWCGWQSAIAMLGLKELSELVERAFKLEFINPSWMSFENFEEDLNRAIDQPASEHSELEGEFSLFGNTVEELSTWYAFSEEYSEQRAKWKKEQQEEVRQKALHNQKVDPFRHVGRNDPCPCGSGKKSKKCCLQLGVEPRSGI